MTRQGKLYSLPPYSSRGGVAITIILLLVILIGAGALVLDVGNLFRVRNELQTAADAAALAGARELDGTNDGIDNARQSAIDYAAHNLADSTQVDLQPMDIIFGHWNSSTSVFTPLGTTPDDPTEANAVQVYSQRSEERANPVDLFLAPIFNKNTSDVTAIATAVGGGPYTVKCPFPLVVSDCSLDNADVSGNCRYCMQFQNNNSDTAGWTGLLATGGLSNPHIAGLVVDACYANGNVSINADGECDGSVCPEISSDGTIQVGNGNFLNTGNNACANGDVANCNNPCPVIQDILTRSGTSDPPESFIVTVPVTQSTPGTCDADQYSGKKQISGFAVVEIFGARCGNNDPEVLDPDFPAYCPPPPSGDYIAGVLKCNMDPIGISGGGFYGLDAQHLRLVQ